MFKSYIELKQIKIVQAFISEDYVLQLLKPQLHSEKKQTVRINTFIFLSEF